MNPQLRCIFWHISQIFKNVQQKLSHFKENKTTICTLKLASQVCEIKKSIKLNLNRKNRLTL